jgi:hypothetical protein
MNHCYSKTGSFPLFTNFLEWVFSEVELLVSTLLGSSLTANAQVTATNHSLLSDAPTPPEEYDALVTWPGEAA